MSAIEKHFNFVLCRVIKLKYLLVLFFLFVGCNKLKIKKFLTVVKGAPMSLSFCHDKIYVVDGSQNALLIFSKTKKLLKKVTSFNQPMDVVCNRDKLYVADFGNDKIVILNLIGEPLASFGSSGSGKGQFKAPSAIAIKDNFIYVAEFYNHRIQKLTLEGRFIDFIGKKGHANGELFYPTDVFVDDKKNLHVADAYNNRLVVFDAENFFVKNYSAKQYGFKVPSGFVYTKMGEYIVADSGNNRVLTINVKGDSSVIWQKQKSKTLTYSPTKVIANKKGDIFVLDTASGNILKFFFGQKY